MTNPGSVALGANPVEKIQDTLGIWGLRLLLATLAITPLRQLTGEVEWLAYRRMPACSRSFSLRSHLLFYVIVDQELAWAILLEDVTERPFITAGFAGFLLLVPLAATSTRRAQRRLGRRWQRLHRLIYVVAVLGCVHFWWQVKADIREPLADPPCSPCCSPGACNVAAEHAGRQPVQRRIPAIARLTMEAASRCGMWPQSGIVSTWQLSGRPASGLAE